MPDHPEMQPHDAHASPSPAEVTAFRQAIVDKLMYTVGKDPDHASIRDWYMAAAMAVRDRIVDRWVASTREAYAKDTKRIYYLSLEFLIGRLLGDCIGNLRLGETCRAALAEVGVDLDVIQGIEPDAALGNGGLGRLAACFMESMASVGLAGFGYGIRYDHGLFRQVIRDGWQGEVPEDWLDLGNPWEFHRPEVVFEVGFGGQVETRNGANGNPKFVWRPSERVLAVAYDTPVVGWQGRKVNTLRLWSARPSEPMQFSEFNRGLHLDAFAEQVRATNISRVLYPDDSTPAGQELRLRQEYFFTSASLQDLIRRHLSQHSSISSLPDAATIQLNDTHPALAVAELVRILVDEHGYALAPAIELARATFAYTNHTLLPEALESWPVPLLERLLPRHMQIIFEINALHLARAEKRPEIVWEQLSELSLINEHGVRRVRMGHLAFVGSKRVNGVSGLHGQLMRETVFKNLHLLYPERITHITNGIAFRRWLHQCNPALSGLLRETIGESWLEDGERLSELERFADDASFCERFAAAKRANKERFTGAMAGRFGIKVDPTAMFDVHIKRMHEYKRQLLNVLQTIAQYNQIRAEPRRKWIPRVKIFAGKAAASYHRAKLVIKLINDVAKVINNDPLARDLLRVVFMPNYNVSLAELIIPAADLSEQISTAGMEASGTGNMKLALNGAMTIGTFDGANVEISERVGTDNIFIFGLRSDEVARQRLKGPHAKDCIAASLELSEALEAVRSGVFSPDEPGRYAGMVDDLANHDYFMVTADFDAYAKAQHEVGELFARSNEWTRRTILNTARMGWFSADRAIRDYARDIWKARPAGTAEGDG